MARRPQLAAEREVLVVRAPAEAAGEAVREIEHRRHLGDVHHVLVCPARVAEHADIWHGIGNLDTIRHKSAVLDDWCVKVGRDPAEIERSTFVHDALDRLDDYADAGITHLVVGAGGPDFDLEPLGKLVAWRDSRC